MCLLRNKFFIIFIFLLLNLLLYGYGHGANSFTSQDLPFIDKILDQSLFPDDLYVSTIHTFPSLYIHIIAFLTKFIPSAPLHGVLYFFLKYALLLIGYQLSLYFFQNKNSALYTVLLLACAPMINNRGLIDSQPLMHNFIYHGSFATPIALFILYLFFRNKIISSLCLLGSLFYVNALTAVHLTVIIFFTSTVQWKTISDKFSSKKQLLIGGSCFILIFLPYLLMNLSHSSSPIFSAELADFLKYWHPGHYFISSWPPQKWITITVYITLFLFLFKEAQKYLSSHTAKMIQNIFLAIGILWVSAVVLGEYFSIRWALILQPLRSDIFFIFLGFVFAGHFIEKQLSSRQRLAFLKVALLTAYLTDYRLISSPPYLIAGSIVFLLCLTYGKNVTKQYQPIRQTFIFLLILIIAILPYVPILRYRLTHKTLTFQAPWKKAWVDLQYWAKSNTPNNSRFITPPYLIGFRTFSQRGTFVERLDGGATHWSPGIEKVWEQRLNELGYGEKPLLEFHPLNKRSPLTVQSRFIYASLNETDFRRLQNKYNLTYVVEESFRPLAFPLVYKNNYFSLYKIPPPK